MKRKDSAAVFAARLIQALDRSYTITQYPQSLQDAFQMMNEAHQSRNFPAASGGLEIGCRPGFAGAEISNCQIWGAAHCRYIDLNLEINADGNATIVLRFGTVRQKKYARLVISRKADGAITWWQTGEIRNLKVARKYLRRINQALTSDIPVYAPPRASRKGQKAGTRIGRQNPLPAGMGQCEGLVSSWQE